MIRVNGQYDVEYRPGMTVQDVLGPQNIARVPLAPPEVAGSLNLRGRIVTGQTCEADCHDVRRRGEKPRVAATG